MPSAPSYLYRNRYGIFYFQRRIPEHLRVLKGGSSSPVFVRISLRTRNTKEALIKARRMSVKFDAIAKQYFETEDDFGYALKKYQELQAAYAQYPNYEDFLEHYQDSAENEFGKVDDATSRFAAWAAAVGLYNNAIRQTPATPAHPRRGHTELKQANGLIPIALSTAFEKFIREKQQTWRTNSDMETTYKREVFPLLLEISGDISTADLSTQHIIEYKEAVLQLPRNRRKISKYKDLSLSELRTMTIPDIDQLSKTTKKNYLDRCISFLAFLEHNKYCMENLGKPMEGVIKKVTRQSDEKNQYTDEDLSKLFNSHDYRTGGHTEAFKFWVPLIALLSGARLNEICQLHLSDIKAIDGVQVFDFNEDNPETTLKSLKRPFHKRQFPIHPKLIELGFLDFVAARRLSKELRLFPELPYRGENKYADKAQKWFNKTYTNERNCNILTPKTSFHSLRHNFISFVTNKLQVPEATFAYYVGQTPKGGVTTVRYSKPEELKEAHKLFSKINYGEIVNFDAIRGWKHQMFARKQRSD
jgi:integrase